MSDLLTDTVGNYTVTGYTTSVMDVTYTPSGGGTAKTGNLYYFDTSVNNLIDVDNLTWTSTNPLNAIPSGEVYIFAAGGGGGGAASVDNSVGGGGGSGGNNFIGDFSQINPGNDVHPPAVFTVGTGAANTGVETFYGGATQITLYVDGGEGTTVTKTISGGLPGATGAAGGSGGDGGIPPEVDGSGVNAGSAGGSGGDVNAGANGSASTSISISGGGISNIYFSGGGGGGGSETLNGGDGGAPGGGDGSSPGSAGGNGLLGTGTIFNTFPKFSRGGSLNSVAGAGGGGGGFGGGGGGRVGGSEYGGAGADGAIFIFIVNESVLPSKPSLESLTLSSTINSITATGDPTGISNSPFTEATFSVYDNEAGDAALYSVSVYAVNGSGNYVAPFNGLSGGPNYWVKWSLTNSAGGLGPASDLKLISLLNPLPSKPADNSLTLTPTTTSFTAVGNTNAISNSPFTKVTFKLFSDEAGLNQLGGDYASNGPPDASGNYTQEFGPFTANATFWVGWYVTNGGDGGGDGPLSNLKSVTTLSPLPSKPDDNSLTLTPTDTTIDVVGNTSGISNPTFISATFTLYSNEAGTAQVSGISTNPVTVSGGPTSGNYTTTFSGLTANTNYWVGWYVENGGDGGGNGTPSNPIPVTTDAAAGGSVPSKPADLSITYVSTDTGITITGDTSGITTDSSFISASFTLYSNADGAVENLVGGLAANPVIITGGPTSGNYTAIFSGLTADTDYWVRWSLENDTGNGPASNPILVPTDPAAGGSAPSKPDDLSISYTATDTTIDIVGYTSGITTDSPFKNAVFDLFSDALGENIVVVGISSPGPPDASGNYTTQIIDLTANTPYWVSWYVENDTGNGPASNLIPVTTGAAAGGSVPSRPPSDSITYTATDTELTVVGDTSGITNPDFVSATFTLYSDVSGEVEYQVGEAVGILGGPTSGNYTAIFSGLTAITNYWVRWLVENDIGAGLTSFTIPLLTYPVTGSPSKPPVLTKVTQTTTTITVTADSSEVTGGTFSGAVFYLNLSNSVSDTEATGIPDENAGVYTFTYTGLTPGTVYYLKWSLSNELGEGFRSDAINVQTDNETGSNPPCFLRGSRILCLNQELKEEYMAIENMRVGTKVKILNGTYVKVHTIGKKTFINPDNADRGPNRLFKLTPKNYPQLTQDLIITGCHSILVDKLLPQQKARHLQLMKTLYMTTGKFRLMSFIDEKAEPYLNPGEHEIWHFALENEEVVCNYGVYANGGLLVETASIKNMTERSGLVPIE